MSDLSYEAEYDRRLVIFQKAARSAIALAIHRVPDFAFATWIARDLLDNVEDEFDMALAAQRVGEQYKDLPPVLVDALDVLYHAAKNAHAAFEAMVEHNNEADANKEEE